MASHYPLNGMDLNWSRYEHRPLGARDILINLLMEEYMFPKRLKAEVFNKPCERGSPFSKIKSRDRDFGLYMQILYRLLKTDYNWTLDELFTAHGGVFIMVHRIREHDVSIQDVLIGLIERHYLESNPSMRIWIKHHRSFCSKPDKYGPGWDKAKVSRLRKLDQAAKTHYSHLVCSGGHHLPINSSSDVQYSIDPCFIGLRLIDLIRHAKGFNSTYTARATRKTAKTEPPTLGSVRRGKQKRSCSAPTRGQWSIAAIEGELDEMDTRERWLIYFPRRPWSELDKLSRRRSLSRTHIRAMFSDKPKWVVKEPPKSKVQGEIKHPCANCAQRTHLTKNCPSSCGYCGAASHKASNCTIKTTNRCKCRPFPQGHTSGECYVRCNRRCGHPQPPGHFKHKNAMLCSYRCCMCGAKGHSGRKCSVKKCPCGERHLTQDCRWKVECPAKGCSFYYCHFHCRECGKKKDKGSKDKFVGRTCQDCLKNGEPVFPRNE
ncbi:uncharacterized protein F4822DRAFT_304155 [Hypoxylon trugodes]|uniref:uncharacterized protein n=1 Tax=Hypoxylon trugodes TaxID=326681 RepID=UPI00218F7928|nr:uncharacterized protein F4822DRAFT_304155 [Hypoxylon trugodes]KAI1386048.1 hypothetical protein F4822DRAFT_304155 [Hypoxylon trugodes]